MTCFKGPILHLLPIHLFLPHFLSTLLPFLIYNSTSDASLPHSSPSLPPPVFSYLLLFPAHYFTFNSCLTFILFFPSFCTSFSHYYSVCSAPHCPPHHFVHIPFSSPFFNFLTYIFFCTHPCFSSIFHFHPSLLLLCLFKGCILKLNPADFSSSLSFPLFSSPAPCHYCFSVLSFFFPSVISFLLKFAIFSPSLHVFFCPPFLPLSLISLSSWFSFSICHFSSFQM